MTYQFHPSTDSPYTEGYQQEVTIPVIVDQNNDAVLPPHMTDVWLTFNITGEYDKVESRWGELDSITFCGVCNERGEYRKSKDDQILKAFRAFFDLFLSEYVWEYIATNETTPENIEINIPRP